jgi:hypothetical protein
MGGYALILWYDLDLILDHIDQVLILDPIASHWLLCDLQIDRFK